LGVGRTKACTIGAVGVTQNQPKARKGSSRRADIPLQTLIALNTGTVETATLAEGLAIDFQALLLAVAPNLASNVGNLDLSLGIVKRMAAAGSIIREAGLAHELADHPSDTVRGWCAFAQGQAPDLSLEARLNAMQPFAADAHFGVREWAWMAVRPWIAEDIASAVNVLAPWTISERANLRRFASEATRPRGVWAAHITALKENPALGEAIIVRLHADPDKYVQDSVGNWLNDAAKDDPDWVRSLAVKWQKTSQSQAATKAILKRALRNL
jgi:3-methyladenine DNA glycosylase AlkC